MVGLALTLGMLGAGASPALAAGAPVPPFTECPAVDQDTSCQYLIDVTGGTPAVNVYEDPNEPYYSGSGETLVGVYNGSANTVSSLYVGADGSTDANFAFDGHGLCAPGGPPIPAGCPFAGSPGVDPFDYEGPNVQFNSGQTITDTAAGTVDFNPPLAANGGMAYFSLHAAPTGATSIRPLNAALGGTAPSPDLLVNNTLSTVGAGPPISVENGQFTASVPTNVSDTVTLEGNNSTNVAGTIDFSVYAGPGCVGTPVSTQSAAVYQGSASTPSAVGGALSGNEVYYWQASLIGANGGAPLATSPCGQSSMAFGSTALPASTLSTSLSAGGQSGRTISVTQGTTVTASVTASGGTGTPGGKAYFSLYSDPACTSQVGAAGGAQLQNGTATTTYPVTLPLGTYYLKVAYTGDPTVASSSSTCGATVINVVNATAASSTTSTSTTSTTTTSTSTAAPLPPPVLYKTVNVTPISGKVYIKLPEGAHLSRVLGARAPLALAALVKGQGFIPLTQARQIPVGSELDTTGGTVAITAANNTRKPSTYAGDFTAGLFTLLQNRQDKGITELNLIDVHSRATVCASRGKAAALTHGVRATIARTVSSKVLALLKGSDHGGRFTTRGSYSAATTRGTAYSVENECAGTLTKVTRGSVVVDYFQRHHKHVIVGAGHAFLAKASGGPSVVVSIGKQPGKGHRAAVAASVAPPPFEAFSGLSF